MPLSRYFQSCQASVFSTGRAFRLTSFGLVLMVVALARSYPAIPDAAKKDPLFAKGYLVVTHYQGVHSDGTYAASTTDGLNRAIYDAYADNLVLYFPQGTYVIDDTLRVHTATGWDQATDDFTTPRNHVAIVGSTKGDRRPLIKLKPGLPPGAGFNDPTTPKPMMEFMNFDDASKIGNKNYEEADEGYNQMLRGVDFDCSHYPGAIGLYLNQAQGSSIENVRVDATGAYAGFKAVPGAVAPVVNIEIEGGQYGIDTLLTKTGGSVIAGAVLRNQEVSAVRYDGFAPLVFVGFEMVTAPGSKRAALTIRKHEKHNGAGVHLIDGIIKLGSEPTVAAIDNTSGTNFYARNVYVTGGNQTGGKLVKSGSSNAAVSAIGTWRLIREYSYCNQSGPDTDAKPKESFTLIDAISTKSPEAGQQGLGNGEVLSLRNDAEPPPEDLLRRHVWSRLPSVDDPDAVDAFVHGIDPASPVVSSKALQGVIDSHRKIFLRKGIYHLDGTVTLRRDTILFGAARGTTRIEVHEDWNPDRETPIITTEDDASATTHLGDLTIGVDATELAHDWFVALDWQAGRNSIVHMGPVYRDPAMTIPINRKPTQPHSLVRIRNSGGGRWYYLGALKSFTSQHPDYRILRVEKTTEPLWFYGLNPEHPQGCDAYVEFDQVSNVRIYNVKSEFAGDYAWESRSVVLKFINATNVALFGHGALRNAVANRGCVEFLGAKTDRVLATLIAPQMDRSSSKGYTLREDLGGGSIGIFYPNVVTLYKRGEITAEDEAAMAQHSDVASRLTNLATRGSIHPGQSEIIAGFAVYGPGTKSVLVRGVGPGLASCGVADCLPNPKIELFDHTGTKIAENDDWGIGQASLSTSFLRVGAFPLKRDSLDAALVAVLPAGLYSAQLTGAKDTNGVGLVEVYEADSGPAQFVNLSTRIFVGEGSSVGIAGIVVSGTKRKRLLIRGIGPTLAEYGVQDPLPDPVLSLVDSSNALVASNDDWGTAVNAAECAAESLKVGAFGLPAASKDAAMLVTISPGAYTGIVRDAGGAAGVVLIEVYEVL